MKRFGIVGTLTAVALCLAACDEGGGITAPAMSAQGMLPAWMFSFDGRLVRPKPGAYDVLFSKEIVQDAELSGQADRVLQAANALASPSGIVFRRSNRSNAPISFQLDPNDPNAVVNAGWSYLHVGMKSYECESISIVVENRGKFLTNVPLHELGHFLFGPGHSDVPQDLMNPKVRDYQRMTFSVNEVTLWKLEQQFPPGTLP